MIDLTYEEALFAVDALKDIVCSPDNLLVWLTCHIHYSDVDFPFSLEKKVNQMSDKCKQELINNVQWYWKVGTIASKKERMIEANLIL